MTDDSIRQWRVKSGPSYANQWRRRRPRLGATRHREEVCRSSRGGRHDRGRAVDQGGHGLDMPVQRRSDKRAATRCCRTRLKGLTSVPRVIMTDQLNSDGAAKREIRPRVEHRPHLWVPKTRSNRKSTQWHIYR